MWPLCSSPSVRARAGRWAPIGFVPATEACPCSSYATCSPRWWRPARPTSTWSSARRRSCACAASCTRSRATATCTPEDTRELVFGILTNEQRQKLEVQWEIDFSYAVPGLSRWRVNAFFQRGAVGAAFRIIPEKIRPLSGARRPGLRVRARATCRAAWCSSPARPARASRRRSPA